MHDHDDITFTSAEVETFWGYVSSSLDRLAGVIDGQPIDVLNWRPPATATNSIYVLAYHTFANARVNLLGNLCGQEIERDRDGEFSVVADRSTPLDAGWSRIRTELEDALSGVSDHALNQQHPHHWRGTLSGRDILIIVARHAAEHLGQVELTRDLAISARHGASR